MNTPGSPPAGLVLESRTANPGRAVCVDSANRERGKVRLMIMRRISVSVLVSVLWSCGGDEPAQSPSATGASGAGTGVQPAAAGTGMLPGAGTGMLPGAGTGMLPATAGRAAAGSGGLAGASSTAAGTGGTAGAPTIAAGSGGTAGMPQSCSTANLTYTDFAAPFFASHCNRCHGQGDSIPRIQRPPRDVTFNSEADLIRSKERIRKIAITDQRMPPGEPLMGCIAEQLSKYLDTLPTQ
jgi:hypothetical protein